MGDFSIPEDLNTSNEINGKGKEEGGIEGGGVKRQHQQQRRLDVEDQSNHHRSPPKGGINVRGSKTPTTKMTGMGSEETKEDSVSHSLSVKALGGPQVAASTADNHHGHEKREFLVRIDSSNNVRLDSSSATRKTPQRQEVSSLDSSGAQQQSTTKTKNQYDSPRPSKRVDPIALRGQRREGTSKLEAAFMLNGALDEGSTGGSTGETIDSDSSHEEGVENVRDTLTRTEHDLQCVEAKEAEQRLYYEKAESERCEKIAAAVGDQQREYGWVCEELREGLMQTPLTGSSLGETLPFEAGDAPSRRNSDLQVVTWNMRP